MEIAASCITFAQAADKTIRTIRSFIIDYRGARNDLSAVNRELSELRLTLNILEDLVPDGSETADPLPSGIRDDIRSIVKNCIDGAKDIDNVLTKHRGKFAAVNWAARGKEKVNSLKAVLEAHRRALNLAVDTITLAMTKSIKNDTEDILEDTADIKGDTTDIKQDITKILEEIARLEALIRRNIPGESSNMFLLNRYLYDLTSVAGSVCGELSRPGTPEPVSERPSTLISTESDHVPGESEASTRSSTLKPSPETSLPHPIPAPLPREKLEARPALELNQRFTLAGESAIVFFGKDTCVLSAHSVLLSKSTSFAYSTDAFLSKDRVFQCGRGIRISDDETKLYVEFNDPDGSPRVRVFEFPSMRRLCSFPYMRGSVTNLTTDGSIFSVNEFQWDRFGRCKALLYDWRTGCSREDSTSFPSSYFLNLSLPVDGDRGLCLQRPRMRPGLARHLHLYQVSRTGPRGSRIKIEDVVLSETPATTEAQYGWNFSHDGRHIFSFFNIQSSPVVETWSFGDDLTTEGDLMPKIQRAEKHSFSLKPHTHPGGNACACHVSEVAMAGNFVVVVSYVSKPDIPLAKEYFITGWNVDTGDVVLQHGLGAWQTGEGFFTNLSRDAKILQINRMANSKEEKQWRKFRDFKSASLISTLEIDGSDLRLVQNYATFRRDDVDWIKNGIGRTFFMSMVKPAEEGELSSWVFDYVLDLRRLDKS